MDENDEYAMTEAEVLDTLQFIVTAERHAQAAERTPSAAEEEVSAQDEDHEKEKEGGAMDPSRALLNPADTSSPSSTPTPAGSGSSTSTSSNTGNPYQNRAKQELDYLKAKVYELEADLRRITKENDAKLAQVDDSMWQRVAQQQNVEKQKSLSENARLKEMLEGQIKFAKSLERVIRKRPNLTAFGGGDGDGTTHNGRAQRQRQRRKKRISSANLYDELSESATREFQRTQQVLGDSGLSQMYRDHRSIELQVIDDDEACNELRVDWRIVRRYPFPFHAVARELWKFLSYASVGANLGRDMERDVERTNDTLFATTVLKFPVSQRQYSLSATAILRQFVDQDSVTIVWISEGECEPCKGDAKDTFKLYEMGWIHMQAVPGDPSSCISRTLGYYYPTFSTRTQGSPTPSGSTSTGSTGSESETAMGSPVNSPSTAGTTSGTMNSSTSPAESTEDIGVLTELLSSVYEKSASQIHTAIENALMAEAISSSQ